jgi:hypothetical protein
MAYLILLPIVLLFTAAVVIFIIRRLRPGFGYSWLLAVLTVLVVWALLLYFHFSPPPALILLNWLPVSVITGTLIFQLDAPAWVYTFVLSGLAVGVILTAAARLQFRSNPTTWAANLAITAAGMLATLAGTPLALVLAWTLIDVIELAFLLAAAQEKQISFDAVVAFLVRATGTLVLMGTMVLSKAGGQDLLLIAPRPDLSIFLLLASGLRLGVLPIHLPYMREPVLRRGISTTLRMAAAASSLVLLARLPSNVVPANWYPWLLFFSGLAGMYAAAVWLISPDELRGRPYWMIALASLAVVSVVRGYPQASLAWGTVLILSGASLFLFSARDLRLSIWPALGGLALTGLPLTPAGAGWLGLSVLPINLPDVWFLLVHVLLLLGYARHVLRAEETLSTMERWIRGVYPFGLLVLVVTAWLAAFFGWPGAPWLERWWASLPALLLAAALWFGLRRLLLPWWHSHPEQTGWVSSLAAPAGRVLNNLLGLNWLYRLGAWLYLQAQRLVQALTVILEGEGGVLWVLVLLALLVSLLQSSGAGGVP